MLIVGHITTKEEADEIVYIAKVVVVEQRMQLLARQSVLG